MRNWTLNRPYVRSLTFSFPGCFRRYDLNDARDQIVRMGFAPHRPAFLKGFQISHDDVAFRDPLAKEACLRADVLDIEVPIVAWFDRLADRLSD